VVDSDHGNVSTKGYQIKSYNTRSYVNDKEYDMLFFYCFLNLRSKTLIFYLHHFFLKHKHKYACVYLEYLILCI
jgi:hypothetical protein